MTVSFQNRVENKFSSKILSEVTKPQDATLGLLEKPQEDTLSTKKSTSQASFIKHKQENFHKASGPLTWNIGNVVTPSGIIATGLWGVSSILEHKVQTHPEQYLGKRNQVLLAKYAPLFTVVYGALNFVGAAAQGYGIRSMAFSSFALASLITAPFIMKDTRVAIKLAQAIKDNASPEIIKKLAQQGERLRNVTSLYNAVAPIGLLVGLFTMTKVAQSTPGVKLEHPEGTSLNDIWLNVEKDKNIVNIVKRNIKTETKTFNQTLLDTFSIFKSSASDYRKAFKNIIKPDDNEKNNSLMKRFQDPIAQGKSVPWFYAVAGAGRNIASAIAIVLSLTSIQSLKKASIYSKYSGEIVQSTQKVKTLTRSMKDTLFVGQVAGSLSALLTIFSDWPVWLSTVYKASGLCYGASAIMAKFPQLGKKIDFGLDEYALTKLGAFIQGSSYLVNLFVKKYSNKDQEIPNH